jgi:predicted Zn finger-like uncharacterized protein
MQIVCKKCATAYRIDGSALGTAGRSVRCVRCSNVQFAKDLAEFSVIAQAYRTFVERLCGADACVAGTGEEGIAAPAVPATDDSPVAATSEGEEALPALEPPATIVSSPTSEAPAASLQPHQAKAILQALTAVEAGPVPPSSGAAVRAGRMPSARRPPRRASRDETGLRRSGRRSRRVLSVAIAVLLALDIALIGWRAEVVRAVPQTRSLYAAIGLPVELRGLLFTAVQTTAETHDGVQVLVVEGTIASTSTQVTEVPRLRFSVRDRTGYELYAWTALPQRSALSPGETLTFRSRLASPPPQVRDVLVRFLTHRDLVDEVQSSAGGRT